MTIHSKNQDLPLTEFIAQWRAGDGAAFSSLIDATYLHLKEMAAGRLRGGDNQLVTLTSHALLNEAVLRVMSSPMDIKNRGHFFATMSLLMRSIIVDFARAKLADKRNGGQANVTFTESRDGEESLVFDILALDSSLDRLSKTDPRSSNVLHLTYFAGMNADDIAALLGVSKPTVERDLRFARAWLQHEMAGGP
ncbi:MAG: ECF-type sigma factor [Burkholderiales bacterium]|nr:sigma-70 family RNA polymerase sigma factor [Nitrosomonadaceae bacterium]